MRHTTYLGTYVYRYLSRRVKPGIIFTYIHTLIPTLDIHDTVSYIYTPMHVYIYV